MHHNLDIQGSGLHLTYHQGPPSLQCNQEVPSCGLHLVHPNVELSNYHWSSLEDRCTEHLHWRPCCCPEDNQLVDM